MKALYKLLILLAFSCPLILQTGRAQETIQPTLPITNRSFAVITDRVTFEKCQKDIMSYRDAIESDDLPTFVIYHDWKNPDQIKKEIQSLYNSSKLEGVVFVGDIPIVLIQRAQHLTNALAPIPSDRFYDDFGLTFDFIEQSKTDPQLYLYSLGVSATNRIKSTIYSARLKPLAKTDKNEDKHQQVSNYLQKAIFAHQKKRQVAHITSYIPLLRPSERLSQAIYLDEQFLDLSKNSIQLQKYNDNSLHVLQSEMIHQFRRKDLDIAIADRYPDQEIMDIQPNVALTIFTNDSKGNFSEGQYVAGGFIFKEGKSIVVLANSVHPTVYRNPTSLLGTLSMGLNIGQWAQSNNTLESHIIGDPTLAFLPNATDTITGIWAEYNNKKLLETLSKTKSPDAKNMILNRLLTNHYESLPKLIAQEYDNSQFASVRYTCLSIALQLGGEVKRNLLAKGIRDADESVCIHAANAMASVGDPAFIPDLVDAYIENQHREKVLFAVRMALHAFNKDLIKNIAEQYFNASTNFTDRVKEKELFYDKQFTGIYAEIDKNIFDTNPEIQKQGIAHLRTINYHPSISRYLEFVRNSKINIELRIAMLESLSCFNRSYRKPEIATACQELIVDTRHSKKLRDEARRTLNNIQ